MSYVAPRFCADRVTPYPREGGILAQATDRSNPQHNLFHPDLVFSNTVYGTTVLKKNVAPDFKRLQAHCQEIGLVALMFFFELFIFLCFSAISLYVPLTNLFSIIHSPYLLITRDTQDEGEARFDSTDTGNSLKSNFTT